MASKFLQHHASMKLTPQVSSKNEQHKLFFESLYQITPLIVFGIETHFVELLDVSNVIFDNYVSMPITP